MFDVCIAVDWSARGKPSPKRLSKDSIWVGEKSAPTVAGASSQETYFRTRQDSQQYLRERLLLHTDAGRRLLLGLDFAYGYPAGYAQALGLPGPDAPWRRTWDGLAGLIVDQENVSNRFEVAAALNARCGENVPGPLWGCPLLQERPSLKATSPGYPYPTGEGSVLPRLRISEARQRGVQPVWKLYGNGSVGSQVLVGIPVVKSLRDDPRLAPFSRVWPFETGFTATPTPLEGPFVLHAEIWPGITTALDPEVNIRDRAQVRAITALFSRLDVEGTLSGLFDRPDGITADDETKVVTEEGWILGTGMTFSS